MTTSQFLVNASANDADQLNQGSSASITTTGTVLDDGTANTKYWAARFTVTGIAQGATISAADLQVYNDNGKFFTLDATIKAYAEDDAAAFAATLNNITNHTLTTASVTWTASLTASAFTTSPDIKTIIQEVVNRSGWVAGNHLALLLQGRNSSAGSIRNWNFDSTTTYSAKLDVTFVSGAVKTIDGLAKASVKTVDGLAIANVKTIDGLA